MIITLDSKRHLKVPSALAPAAPGDRFDAHFDETEHAVVFRRIGKTTDWLSVLKQCPVPMDDISPRRRELRKPLP